jgi:hypothetical protein
LEQDISKFLEKYGEHSTEESRSNLESMKIHLERNLKEIEAAIKNILTPEDIERLNKLPIPLGKLKIKFNSPEEESQMVTIIQQLIDKNYILKKDIVFSSLSTASTFVSGYTCNGFKFWKIKNRKLKIKDYIEGGGK